MLLEEAAGANVSGLCEPIRGPVKNAEALGVLLKENGRVGSGRAGRVAGARLLASPHQRKWGHEAEVAVGGESSRGSGLGRLGAHLPAGTHGVTPATVRPEPDGDVGPRR